MFLLYIPVADNNTRVICSIVWIVDRSLLLDHRLCHSGDLLQSKPVRRRTSEQLQLRLKLQMANFIQNGVVSLSGQRHNDFEFHGSYSWNQTLHTQTIRKAF